LPITVRLSCVIGVREFGAEKINSPVFCGNICYKKGGILNFAPC